MKLTIEEIRNKLNAEIYTKKAQAKAIDTEYSRHVRFLKGDRPKESDLPKYEKYVNGKP